MADYPCDNHHARYTGPSHRAYLNIFREDEEIRFKTSVCADCLADLVTAWLTIALAETPGGGWDPIPEDTELTSLWKASRGRSDRSFVNGRR